MKQDELTETLTTINNTQRLLRESIMLMLNRVTKLEEVNQELEKRILKLEENSG